MIAPLRVLSLALVVAGLALAGCGSDEKSSADTTAETSAPVADDAPAAAGATLTISGFKFSAVAAVAGEPISITNADGAPHTVTADDGSFDVKVSDTAELVIPSAGTYAIHCEIHSSMTGSIVVS